MPPKPIKRFNLPNNCITCFSASFLSLECIFTGHHSSQWGRLCCIPWAGLGGMGWRLIVEMDQACLWHLQKGSHTTPSTDGIIAHTGCNRLTVQIYGIWFLYLLRRIARELECTFVHRIPGYSGSYWYEWSVVSLAVCRVGFRTILMDTNVEISRSPGPRTIIFSALKYIDSTTSSLEPLISIFVQNFAS